MEIIYQVEYKTRTDATGIVLSRMGEEYSVHGYYNNVNAKTGGDYFTSLKLAKERFYKRSQALLQRLAAV